MTQVLWNGLLNGLLIAPLALGFGIIYRSTKVLHVAHGAIYTASAYILLFLLQQFNESGAVILLAGAPVALLSAILLSLACERFVYRPLYEKRAGPLVTFVSSLGIYIIIVNFISLRYGNSSQIFNIDPGSTLSAAGIIATKLQVIQLAACVVSVSAVFWFLHRTLFGRRLRAVSDNSILASVMGIDVETVRFFALATGSLLAAVSSMLRASDVGIDPYSGFAAVLTAAVAVIIGGVDSFSGAVLGSIFLGITQSLVVWFFSAQWQEAFTFVVFIAVLLFRREGLLSAIKRVEEA